MNNDVEVDDNNNDYKHNEQNKYEQKDLHDPLLVNIVFDCGIECGR